MPVNSEMNLVVSLRVGNFVSLLGQSILGVDTSLGSGKFIGLFIGLSPVSSVGFDLVGVNGSEGASLFVFDISFSQENPPGFGSSL